MVAPAIRTDTLPEVVKDVYSKDILVEAAPLLKFDTVSIKKVDLSVSPGLTVKFLRYGAATAGAALAEDTEMTADTITAALVPITVTEYGKAKSVSEKLLQASFDDVMATMAKILGQSYALTLDNVLRDKALTGTNVTYASTATARAEIAAAMIFGTKEVKDAVEILKTNNAPMLAVGGRAAYVAFIHPHQARAMRDDANWVSAQQYAGAVSIFNGEIGRYEDVIFIETTQMPILVNAGLLAAVDVYQSVIVGDNALAHAIALPVEMRDNGVEDFGRKHSLAWYAIMGAGIIEDKNIVRIETA